MTTRRGRKVDAERDQKLTEIVLEGARRGISAFQTMKNEKAGHPQSVYRILRRTGRLVEYKQLIKLVHRAK